MEVLRGFLHLWPWKVQHCKHLVEVLLNLEDSHSVLTWIARVPSPSNVSDGPSRGFASELEAQNATCCNVENLLDILLKGKSLDG